MDVENCPVPMQGSQVQMGEDGFGNTGKGGSEVNKEGQDHRGQNQQRRWNKRGRTIFYYASMQTV